MVPHITDEIKRRIQAVASTGRYDVVIFEVGGTVGDIESLPYLEAIRQFALKVGHRRAINILVTLVPYIKSAGELKTKPTQHSVKTLLEIGVQPDILICRSEHPLSREVREKIGLFCNVQPEAVISGHDVRSIYEVPLVLEKEELAQLVIDKLNLKCGRPDLRRWSRLVHRINKPAGTVRIAVCGKYTSLLDAYILVYLRSTGLIRYLHLFNPDLAWNARISGSFAGIWAILRTGLILRTLRKQ